MNLEDIAEGRRTRPRGASHRRKRAEEKTPARDHGKDYHAAQDAANRLDHYAHELYRLHDAEYPRSSETTQPGDRT